MFSPWRIAFAAALATMWSAGAGEAMTQAALDGIAVEPRPGAALPLDLTFMNDDAQAQTLDEALSGKPAVVVFMDYTCRTLCGPILTFVSTALEQSGLTPNADYRLVVVGLDTRDDLNSARAAKTAHVGSGSALAAATVMLRGDETATRSAATALGYRYAYDAEHDQFAHPAAAFVVTPAGRVSRVLTPLALNGFDLRLALVEAGQGRVGTLGDRLRLLCYGFDPASGIYTETITLWLELSAIVTMAGMAAAIVAMNARARRNALATRDPTPS